MAEGGRGGARKWQKDGWRANRVSCERTPRTPKSLRARCMRTEADAQTWGKKMGSRSVVGYRDGAPTELFGMDVATFASFEPALCWNQFLILIDPGRDLVQE